MGTSVDVRCKALFFSGLQSLRVGSPGKQAYVNRVRWIDLLTELRRTDELPPTILLTTFDDDEALLDGIKAGAPWLLAEGCIARAAR